MKGDKQIIIINMENLYLATELHPNYERSLSDENLETSDNTLIAYALF